MFETHWKISGLTLNICKTDRCANYFENRKSSEIRRCRYRIRQIEFLEGRRKQPSANCRSSLLHSEARRGLNIFREDSITRLETTNRQSFCRKTAISIGLRIQPGSNVLVIVLRSLIAINRLLRCTGLGCTDRNSKSHANSCAAGSSVTDMDPSMRARRSTAWGGEHQCAASTCI